MKSPSMPLFSPSLETLWQRLPLTRNFVLPRTPRTPKTLRTPQPQNVPKNEKYEPQMFPSQFRKYAGQPEMEASISDSPAYFSVVYPIIQLKLYIPSAPASSRLLPVPYHSSSNRGGGI